MSAVLVFVSHGTLAEGVYSAAAMMLGETEDIKRFCLENGEDSASFRCRVRDGIRDLKDRPVLLFCDLLGGSPMTVTLDDLTQAGIPVAGVYGGLNLAMAVTGYIHRDRDDVQEWVLREGKASVAALSAGEEDDEI